jgi:hypothetical protein
MLAKVLARRPDRRQGSLVAIVLVAIGAITFSVLAQGSPTASQAPGSSATTGAQATRSAPPSSDPSATPEAWAPLELSPLAAVATLQPSSDDAAGIPPDATFALASLTAEPAHALGARLEVTPELAFTVTDAADSASATIEPSGPLSPGETYRFVLRNADQTVAGSWAFHVRGPVAVINTIPGNATTDVPLRTGIEITFDQEDVADMADHFSIRPAVKGTFERHGRTQVFVPSKLAPATTYTVTVRHGLVRTGTDLQLASDLVFRFETQGEAVEQPRLLFAREAIEAVPDEPLTIAIEAIRPWQSGEQTPAPDDAQVRVYRLSTLDAANRALSSLLAAPHWTQYSDPLIPTKGLPLVTTFRGPLTPLARNIMALKVPVQLAPGWYLLEIPGSRRSQAFLQITPVSAWVSVMHDRTVVWVNDVVTHQAIEGASVAIGDGRAFARSDADGLAIGTTPTALIPPAAGGNPGTASPVLRVTSPGGQVVLVPFNVRGDEEAYRGEWWEMFGSADETYWSALYTDRDLYRQTDRIELWGYLRGRDDDKVPARVQVRLVTSDAGSNPDAATLASVEARPAADGSFAASLPVADLPIDSYAVQAVVDGRVVVSHWVEVTIIRKPAYQLQVVTEPRAVITGTPVTLTATATFFDGTPTAGLPITVSGDEAVPQTRLTTDDAGHASMTLNTPTSSTSWRDWRWVQVAPTGPESGDITTGASILIFPSAYNLDGNAQLAGARLTFTGTVTEVDLAKVNRALAANDWNYDPAGPPVAGATVEAKVIEVVPIRRQVGEAYDFVDKVVRPIYDYDYTYEQVAVIPVTSGSDGRIRFSTQVAHPDHDYQIELSTRDGAGRLLEQSVSATSRDKPIVPSGVEFVTDDGKAASQTKYGIGDRISWRMVDDGRDLPSGSGDRYLYVVAQRGLRAAAVTDSPRFRHIYTASDAPGIFVMGIRFTGTTYAPKAATWADFDTTDRTIRVVVTADRARYRPGDTARLSVRTVRPDGSPVPATVAFQVVDEKLFSMGAASVPRPIDDLYARVDSGIIRLTATHQVPSMTGPEGEGGDTTGGGGDRSEFKDTLLFRQVRTDASGRATTTVRLSDDLTSWHVSAAAVTADLSAGVGELLVPVGLPFFVELTVADTYLVSDRPLVRVRAYGDALRAGDPVEFSVSSPSLGLAPTSVHGTAFEPVTVALPVLSIGTQSIAARGVAPTRKDDAGKPLADGLTRTFEVVTSRLTAGTATYGLLTDGLPGLPAGADRASWTFVDAGRGRLLTMLSGLAEAPGLRLDRAVAESRARQVLVEAFGRDATSFSPADINLSRYPIADATDNEGTVVQGGVALVPSGGPDPWLAVRVALLAPDALPISPLREALLSIRDARTTRRDLQVAAIAAVAGLGEPVLDDLRTAARLPGLTPTEQLYLALGFEAVGDDSRALAIERDLLARAGERLGGWIRLRFGRTADGADATALMAVVAASLGDPLAAGLADYAMSHPATDSMNALELEAYAARALDRTPAAPASFAYTVAGHRTVVQLGAGEALTLRLTATQAATLSAETLSGQVGVTVGAQVAVAASSLHQHGDLTLTRTLPSQPVPADRLVEVDLTAVFAEGAVEGCYDVTELVPSGLAPLPIGRAWTDEKGITWPTSVIGQEVRFCAGNDPSTGRPTRLRYLARVVNEGAFTWEPAIIQLPSAPEMLASTLTSTVRIGQP